MEEEMSVTNELKVSLLETYTMLQEIKAASKEENPVLEYKLKKVTAQLNALDVNTTNLEL